MENLHMAVVRRDGCGKMAPSCTLNSSPASYCWKRSHFLGYVSCFLLTFLFCLSFLSIKNKNPQMWWWNILYDLGFSIFFSSHMWKSSLHAWMIPDVQSLNPHHRPLRTGVGNLACRKSSFQLRYNLIHAQYKTLHSRAVLTSWHGRVIEGPAHFCLQG